jgi:hypothetical protein
VVNSAMKKLNPVRLPLGLARLATRPSPKYQRKTYCQDHETTDNARPVRRTAAEFYGVPSKADVSQPPD